MKMIPRDVEKCLHRLPLNRSIPLGILQSGGTWLMLAGQLVMASSSQNHDDGDMMQCENDMMTDMIPTRSVPYRSSYRSPTASYRRYPDFVTTRQSQVGLPASAKFLQIAIFPREYCDSGGAGANMFPHHAMSFLFHYS